MYKLINGWTKESVMAQVKKYNNGTKSLVPVTGSQPQCLYRSSDGNRCAVGCFIPDGHEALNAKMGALILPHNYPELRDYMPFSPNDGLCEFQNAHDVRDGNVYDNIQHFLDRYVE